MIPREWLVRHLAFVAAQRRVLIVLLALGVGYGVYRYARDRSMVPTPQADLGQRQAELADRIDPNDADWATLAVLPGIGEKKARDIVSARELRRERHPNDPPFKSAEDLYIVKGIGAATVDKLRPYLTFRTPRRAVPATQPEAAPSTTGSAPAPAP